MRVFACDRSCVSRVCLDSCTPATRTSADLDLARLDIKGIENVINYEMPRSIEIYLHRVGRTARAGKKGRSV